VGKAQLVHDLIQFQRFYKFVLSILKIPCSKMAAGKKEKNWFRGFVFGCWSDEIKIFYRFLNNFEYRVI
jgi:hypothetical protein